MNWRNILIPVFIFAASAASAQQQQQAQPQKPQPSQDQMLGLGAHDSSAPIAVSADAFTGDFQTKVGMYTGNVLIAQGDIKLRADKVKIVVDQGKPNRIEATGNVVLNAPSGAATGDTGVYDLVPRTITLTGHVVLTKEKNVMRGTSLVVNLVTGQARLGAQGMPGGRVQGLFTPPPQSSNPAKK